MALKRKLEHREMKLVLMFAVSCLLIVAIAYSLASLIADIAVIWLFTHYMKDQYKGDDSKWAGIVVGMLQAGAP